MTKIPRHTPLWDQCNFSMKILWQRCEAYFKRHGITENERFYTDYHTGLQELNNSWAQSENLEVITFGDTVKKMFLTGNYPQKNLRFWNIGSRFKEIQDQLLFQGEDVVNAIPRYELFNYQDSKPIDWNKRIDFVFAGRLSRQKNIDFLILFVDELQRLEIDCRLHLFGDYDERIQEHLGRQTKESAKTSLTHVIKSLECVKPIFYGHVESEEWLKKDFSQPVVISLSTFFGEDFGVSIAQAQEKGWPVICSAFGGHLDILGNQVGLVSPSFMMNGLLCLEAKKILAEKAAQFFLKERFREIKPALKQPSLKFVSQGSCDEKRRELIKTIGPSVHWLCTDTLDNFSDLSDGGLFIRKCLEILEGEKREKDIIILSAHARESLSEKEAFFLRETLQSMDGSSFDIILSHELTFKDNLYLLKRANHAFLSPDVDEKNKAIIRKIFP